MARLTEAVEVLVASLEKAQSDLEWVANRLEEEFSTRYKRGEINPLDVLTRIHRLRRELPALAEECADVLQAKQECVDAAKRHLLGNADLLRGLQRKAGIAAAPRAGDDAQSSFEAAVREHESKLHLRYDDASQEMTYAEVNEAFVHSVVA